MKPAMLQRVTMAACAALALGLATTAANATVFTATLNGAIEAPPNESPGTGTVTVDFDIATHMMTIDVTFSGLLGLTTAAHIHCCTAAPETGTAGVATELPTFTGFPTGVTSGTYSHVFDTSLAATWNPTFITNNGGTVAGAESAFLAGLESGTAYLNLHSEFAPGGEIRGFLQPVPEPATYALLALGAPVVLLAARRRRGK
ncbi:CHRD domain-containing protein [Pseudoduganella sp. SL102]|uniref:CHRD domain-containing protein n=1 Tax=Pseudoduganella sp. SL102 TaxID=2995154 RepID=UPI00248B3496|nr:CHRD domain-containing protein [Pseudoduganella sp. SL102]WBS01271.1 CHRD domain-containing protein [Pseudoduganella sp. SL102]